MTEEKLYIFLDIIFRNGSVKRLSREGVDYNEIAKQTQKAIENGLIEYNNERVILTSLGITRLKELESQYIKTNKNEWIEKDLKNQISRIEKNFIFVPRQNELTF